MPDYSQSDFRDPDRLDVEDVKRFVATRWKFVLATALVCLGIAIAVCLVVTPTYTATSEVLLDPHKTHVFGGETVNPDITLDSSVVDSQISIILSNRILAKVVRAEQLADDPEFAAPTRAGLFGRVFDLFRSSRTSGAERPSPDGLDPKIAPVILRLFDRVDVTRLAKSYVLSISVSSRDPVKAMRLANVLAQTYVADQIEVHSSLVQQTATFFEQRLGGLRDRVRDSERAVAEFRKANNINTTTADGQITVGQQQLQSLNEELAKVSGDTAEKLALYQQGLRFSTNNLALDTLPDIVRSPVIAQLRAQQADLTRREADLAAMYGPAHPAMAQIQAQRQGLERAISAEMRRLTATMRNDYEVAKTREASLQRTIALLSDRSGGDSDIGVKLRELERAAIANKVLFENFLNRAKLAQEQSGFEEPDARLISPALQPTTPTSPKVKLILPVTAIAGLLLGLGLAAVIDLTGTRPRAAPLEENQGNAFILARVPTVAGARRATDLAADLAARPASPFAARIDAIATKLARDGVREQGTHLGHIVALASLRRGEGASSLVLSLATRAAANGKRVLLIDVSPSVRGLSRLLDAVGEPGLIEVIAGSIAAADATLARSGFSVMPIGRGRPDFDKILPEIGKLLEEARRRFDLILVDAPSFEAVATATSVCSHADGFALVASYEQIVRDAFIAAIDRIADKPAFRGIILNRMAGDASFDYAAAV